MTAFKIPRILLIMALLAVFVRALVPMGYMPDLKSENGFEMVICGINGPMKMMVDENFNPIPDDHHDKAPSCEFALLKHLHMNNDVHVPVVAASVVYEVIAAQRLQSVSRVAIYDVAPPPSQGPPVFV